MNKQQGFTLIELVIVIVILGILAATALPRFADLTGDAELAARDGILGGVRSASAIAHAQSIIDDVANGDIVIEGATINFTNGYPTGSATGIAAMLDTGLTPDTTTTPGTAVWTISTDCFVSYTTAPNNSSGPTITAGNDNCGQ